VTKAKWTLVTGASGFVGSTLVRRLIERGVHVKAFVRPGADLTPLSDLRADRLQLAYGDVTIETTVFRALMGCDRLFHVASPFRYWSARPRDILVPAVQGTEAVLTAARRSKLDKIVVTSSAGVLGVTTSDEPMDEQHENQLTDPETYIRAKIEAAQVVEEHVAGGMPIVSVLPSGIFGPGDHRPTPNGRTIIEYLKTPAHRRIPATSGGISVVDVEDVADGHILAMEKGRIGERYLLGGENITFRGFFETLHDLTGLAEPGRAPSRVLINLVGRVLELSSRFTRRDPLLTYRLARDYAFARVWVTSAKAARELGYTYRPARVTLARSIHFYLASNRLPELVARRIRLELRPA
jgi:dihydroflavonol-4-reductase